MARSRATRCWRAYSRSSSSFTSSNLFIVIAATPAFREPGSNCPGRSGTNYSLRLNPIGGSCILNGAGEADFLFGEAQVGVEGAGSGVEGAGVQGEVAQAVVAGPTVGGGDQRPADAPPGRAVGDDELADVAVALAGEVGARL